MSPGWPAIVWMARHFFGPTVTAARFPSVVFGTATILVVFVLAYRTVRAGGGANAFIPAIVGASLAALSVTQLEFSQRIYPYVALPFLAGLLASLHLEILRSLRREEPPSVNVILLAAVYAGAAGFSLWVHASMVLVVAMSLLVLVWCSMQWMLRWNRDAWPAVLGIYLLVGLAVGAFGLLSFKNPGSGYRVYLQSYYHPIDIGAIGFVLTRTYDLFTYNLNLFYNPGLYWPRQLNPVLLPLLGLCLWGWWLAGRGRFGGSAKHLSHLALACLLLPALLSLLRRFPFGGVRQMLFMSPFLLAFTGFAFSNLLASRRGRILSAAVAGVYVILWGIYLPDLYRHRVLQFDPQRLMSFWEQNGRLPYYVDGGCGDAIKYLLRSRPEIRIDDIGERNFPQPPFFWLSTHWDLDHTLYYQHLHDRWKAAGYTVSLLVSQPAPHDGGPEYVQSIYFPPNGLWIYKVTPPP